MLELATPWALSMLIVPFLAWFLIPAAEVKSSSALIIPFFSTLKGIVSAKQFSLKNNNNINILFIVWLFLVIALSGPRWVGNPQPLDSNGYNIMLALDISPSMSAKDMLFKQQTVTRLSIVKRAAMQFVRDRLHDRIGLILFGSQAYLQTPLTYDRQNVLMRIDDATVGLAGQSTSIGDAIGLAVKRLQRVSARGRLIILLTDGVNTSGILTPTKAAELAKNDRIKIYTIGLSSMLDPQTFGGMFMNLNATADLDEKTLRQVAKLTGGRYFRATDNQSLQNIYQLINKLETTPQQQATVRPQKDYYPWPLSIAICVFLYWLGRIGYFHTIKSMLHKRKRKINA